MTALDALDAKGLCYVHAKFGKNAFANRCRNVKCALSGAGRASVKPDKGRGRGQGNANGGGR